MSRMTPRWAALAAALVLSSAAVAAPLAPRTSDAYSVMITVTPQGAAGGAWDFEVSMNTHSGALDDDLVKTAVLFTGDGKRVAPTAWRGDAPGGHHRKGVLRFESVPRSAGPLELRIARRSEPTPRSFQWTLE